jgi:hypothetical protein
MNRRHLPRSRSALASLAAATLSLTTALSACSGGGTSGGATTSGDGDGTTSSSDGSGGSATRPACFDYAGFDGMSPAVSFSKEVLPILRNSCGFSSCHGNVSPTDPARHYFGPSNGDPAPDMTQIAAIFAQSVGKPAALEPNLAVIEPGKPDKSFLLYKLDGASCTALPCAAKKTCGTSMPQSNPLLVATKVDAIRRWIAQGAKND